MFGYKILFGTNVVPQRSGKLGRAYIGRCEACPGIPMGTGNER